MVACVPRGACCAITKREHDVLTLIVAGMSAKQIAFRLGISVRTVETHTKNLYRKLDVQSRLQAFVRATELGLVRVA